MCAMPPRASRQWKTMEKRKPPGQEPPCSVPQGATRAPKHTLAPSDRNSHAAALQVLNCVTTAREIANGDKEVEGFFTEEEKEALEDTLLQFQGLFNLEEIRLEDERRVRKALKDKREHVQPVLQTVRQEFGSSSYCNESGQRSVSRLEEYQCAATSIQCVGYTG